MCTLTLTVLSLTFPIHSFNSSSFNASAATQSTMCMAVKQKKKLYGRKKYWAIPFFLYLNKDSNSLHALSLHSLSLSYFPPPHYTHGTTRLPSFFFTIIIIIRKREMLTVSFIIAVFLFFSWGVVDIGMSSHQPTILFSLPIDVAQPIFRIYLLPSTASSHR